MHFLKLIAKTMLSVASMNLSSNNTEKTSLKYSSYHIDPFSPALTPHCLTGCRKNPLK
jgi:hypothetical protein